MGSMFAGNKIGGFLGVFTFILALAIVAGIVYLLVRPYKEAEHLKQDVKVTK